MRILAGGEPIPVDKLGLSDLNHARLLGTVSKPYGLFFVCGPTGSGKTTTLHSILGHLNTPERKIWTAEDPVEITQKGLRQVQVQPKIGFDFSAAMRAFLRADPDIIMVGEMRDKETTNTGIEASLTGHLVFATLHTNSAPESIVRLLDMGMDPFNFADALLGVLAQRPTKRLCTACKEEHTATDENINELLAEYHSDQKLSDNFDELLKETRKEGSIILRAMMEISNFIMLQDALNVTKLAIKVVSGYMNYSKLPIRSKRISWNRAQFLNYYPQHSLKACAH